MRGFLRGDLLRARELQLKAQPLVDALFSEVNPIPVKKALNLMGLEVGPLRPDHGDDTGECREACRSDEKLRNKVSIKEQMTPAEGSRKAIRRSMCLHRRLHAARGAGSTEKRG